MLLAGAVALAAGAVGAGCSSDEGADQREQAIEDQLDRYPGQIDRSQAECYVDRVIDELGIEAVAPDAEPTDAQIRRLTAIRVDCIGIAGLGRAGTSVPPSGGDEPPLTLDGPRTFGDDPELDELWAACEAGDGPSCDALFDAAPLGSDYETFGATCGGRGAEARCGDVYPALSTTASSTTASSTTVTTGAPTTSSPAATEPAAPSPGP